MTTPIRPFPADTEAAADSTAHAIPDVHCQPIPPAVDAVRRALTAVLASEPPPPIEEALTVAEALDVLLDVDPPYPPLVPADEAPAAGDATVHTVLAHLDAAAATATSVRELTRYTAVALLLQQLPGAVTR